MITVSHLTMRLTAGGHVITILDDISLEVPEKQMVAIVGPSGSVASTTGRQVIDLLLSLNRDHGSTLMLVTHDPDLASCAQRIISVRDGRIESDEVKVRTG